MLFINVTEQQTQHILEDIIQGSDHKALEKLLMRTVKEIKMGLTADEKRTLVKKVTSALNIGPDGQHKAKAVKGTSQGYYKGSDNLPHDSQD